MNRRSLAKDFLVRLASVIFLHLRGLILLPLIANLLGSVEYGIWTQISITVQLLAAPLTLRFETAAVRYLSSETDHRKIRRDLASMLIVIWGLFAAVSLLILRFERPVAQFLFEQQTPIHYVHVLLLFLAARITYTFLLNYYRVFDQIAKYSLLEVLTAALSIAAALGAALLGLGLPGIVLAFAAFELLTAGFAGVDIVRQIGWPREIGFRRLIPYLSYSLPLVLNPVLNWTIASSDRYVVNYFLGLESVGVYTASYMLSQFVSFAVIPMGFVLFPAVSRMWEEGDRERAARYISGSLRYLILLAIPSLVGIYHLAPDLLRALATETFVTSRMLILTVGLGALFYGIYQLTIYVIHLVERTKIIMPIFLVIAAVNVGLNIVLVPDIGLLGAGVSTLVSYVLLMAVISWLATRTVDLHLDVKSLGLSIVASLGMLGVLQLVELEGVVGIGVSILTGAVVYGATMFVLGGIRREDLRLAASLLPDGR